MKSKLTLSIDTVVVQKAKIFTGKRKQSLSLIVENYLKSFVMKPDSSKSENKLTFTKNFRKKFPPPNLKVTDKEMQKAAIDYLLKKHG